MDCGPPHNIAPGAMGAMIAQKGGDALHVPLSFANMLPQYWERDKNTDPAHMDSDIAVDSFCI